MASCTKCFYAKRTTITTYELAFTCLHPKSRDVVGFPMICRDARAAVTGFCGPEGSCFVPAETGSPQPEHVFRQ